MVGVIAHFEFKPGNQAAIDEFFAKGLTVVQRQPVTTMWFGFRLGPTTYGAFAAFANEADREALLTSGGPKLARENPELFAKPLSFEKVDVIGARYDGQLDTALPIPPHS